MRASIWSNKPLTVLILTFHFQEKGLRLFAYCFQSTSPGTRTNTCPDCTPSRENGSQRRRRFQVCSCVAAVSRSRSSSNPGNTEILIEMDFRNLTGGTCRNLRANICASLNHLPGEPGWSNRDFIPASVPLDRDLQGRYWYEKGTPRSLQYWTGGSWGQMHAFPDRPSADTVNRYFFKAGELDNAYACALQSQNGKKLFYQAWSAPCQHWSPFPGNACTHLLPMVASQLEPEQTARITGMVGVFSGNRSELAQRIRSGLLLPSD